MIRDDNKNKSHIEMPITTTAYISSSNHQRIHHHQLQRQAFAAAVATGQMVVVVRMVKDPWYLVPGWFFSSGTLQHTATATYTVDAHHHQNKKQQP